jgi:putative nucleotidyltransferase with HDIG domain
MSLALASESLPRLTSVLILDSETASDTRQPRPPRGCRIDHATSLSEARDFLHFRDYSLVLCSQSLPGDVRHELLAHISQSHAGLPCVFLPRPRETARLGELLAQAGGERPQARLKSDLVLTDTLRALVAAMDARDPSNRRHSQRVTQLALVLGEALGLSAPQMEMLELSALLHDVGKIAVPEQILAKPGPLDEGEWCVVRTHAAHSAEIVRQVASLAEVAVVVRHHHERVDGTGYPDGLAGSDIPSLSQLISIVDAYEAMTTDRCYRPAMDQSQARKLIRQGLGNQFDPEMGTVFLSLQRLP